MNTSSIFFFGCSPLTFFILDRFQSFIGMYILVLRFWLVSEALDIHRWKHAAACHHDSTIEGEGDYYEHDDIYTKLTSFEHP